MSWNNYGRFPEYISVAERKKKIAQQTAKLKAKNKKDVLQPIVVQGRLMAKTFWGKAWFKNLESYADYAYRLDRGRSYVRNGAVADLKIQSGEIHALVCGTRTYKVHITILATSSTDWRSLIKECSGKINSLVELLQGKFSQHIMQIITQPDRGLFPKNREISFNCSCPDHASMCKHVSAVLYGVGIRLDDFPEQLFMLRQVDHMELLLSAVHDVPLGLESAVGSKVIDDDDLSQLFGIDIMETPTKKSSKKVKKTDLVAATKKVSGVSKKKKK